MAALLELKSWQVNPKKKNLSALAAIDGGGDEKCECKCASNGEGVSHAYTNQRKHAGLVARPHAFLP